MRYKESDAEKLMLRVLEHSNESLSLDEIVEEIHKIDPQVLRGNTPTRSLYSIIYRREKRRIESGEQPLFESKIRGRTSFYFLKTNG